jgi:hypothetical protein
MNSTTAAASTATPVDPKAFKRFAEFYPFYLTEHSHSTCRRLHFLGSTLALLCLAMGLYSVVRLRLRLGGPLRLREEQARQLQAPALQLHGRLGDVQGHVAGACAVLMACLHTGVASLWG